MASIATGRGKDFIGCVELRDTHRTYRLPFRGILPQAVAAARCTPDGHDLFSRLVQAARGDALGTVQGSPSLVQVPAASSVGAEDSWEVTVDATLNVFAALRDTGHALALGARGLRIYVGADAESRLVLDRGDTCFLVLGARAPDGLAVSLTHLREEARRAAEERAEERVAEDRRAAVARSTAMAGARASGGPVLGNTARRRVGAYAACEARGKPA
jgi:hypothetical protein